ncbi:MAG: glycosyltransferase family 39 protein [Bacteroidota bacterium]
MTLRPHAPGGNGDAPGTYRLLAGAETLLALGLGFFRLGRNSLWLDEVFSFRFARDLGSMLEHDGNGWLYYGLLSVWRVFGESESALRSLSVLACAGAIPFAVGVGRRLFNEKVGLAAGLLLAVHPTLVFYAQEARGYALLLLLVSAASWCFLKGLEGRGRMIWVLYAGLSALSLYVHVFGAFAVCAHAVALCAWGMGRVMWKRAAGAWVGIALAGLPLLIFQPGEIHIGWLGGDPLGRAYPLARNLLGTGWLLAAFSFFGALEAASAFSRRISPREDLPRTIVPILWVLVPFVLGFGISAAIMPVLLSRYLLFCLPPIAVLAAAGLLRLDRRLAAGGMLLLLFLAAVPLVKWYLLPDRKEDWRGLTAHVLAASEEGDAVAFHPPWVRAGFDYYMERQRADPDRLRFPELLQGAALPQTGERVSDLPFPDVRRLAELGARYRRIWLVRSHEIERLGRRAQGDFICGEMEKQFRLRETRAFAGIILQRFERF